VRWGAGPGIWLTVAGGLAVIAGGAVIASERTRRP
jgi:hypothetical protein